MVRTYGGELDDNLEEMSEEELDAQMTKIEDDLEDDKLIEKDE